MSIAEEVRDGLDFLTVVIAEMPHAKVVVRANYDVLFATIGGDFEIGMYNIERVQTQMVELGWYDQKDDPLRFRYVF